MQHEDNQFEVAVVGGGIVGLAIAYQSAVRGQRVILFERHPKAQGATIRSTATTTP